MTRRQIVKWLAVFVIATVAVAAIWVECHRGPRQPVYQGRKLSSWIIMYQQAGWENNSPTPSPEMEEAAAAIRQIGTNALPTLLRWASAQDSPSENKTQQSARDSLRIRERLDNLLFHLGILSAQSQHSFAFTAIAVLGADAKPLVPDLVRLLNAHDFSIQLWTVGDLGRIGSAAAEAIPALIHHLQDPELDADIRPDFVSTLRQIHCPPALVIPVYKEILGTPQTDEKLRHVILSHIKQYGRDAHEMAPIVVALLNNPDPDLTDEATNVLMQIAPDGATNNWANYKKR